MTLSIGDLAKAASVNVQTVRYYERRGLLRPQRRTTAGYRQYDGDAVKRLRFIKHAQLLGFSLKEVDELLALRVRHGGACATVERKTRAKIALVDERIHELGRLKRSLETLARACEARTSTAECPLLEVLDDNDVVGNG